MTKYIKYFEQYNSNFSLINIDGGVILSVNLRKICQTIIKKLMDCIRKYQNHRLSYTFTHYYLHMF